MGPMNVFKMARNFLARAGKIRAKVGPIKLKENGLELSVVGPTKLLEKSQMWVHER